MLVSNATLTEILPPLDLDRDNYDSDPGPGDASGAPKWQDSKGVAAYLDEDTIRVTTATGSEWQRRWIIYLDLYEPPVIINIGDRLTIRQTQADRTTATFTVPVQSINSREQPDMPLDVQSRKLVVEPSSSSG